MPRSALTFGLALLSCLALPARVLAARRDLAALGALDDRGLADIGIGRHDLRDVSAYSWFEDPTARLAERARERADVARDKRKSIQPPPPPASMQAPMRDWAA